MTVTEGVSDQNPYGKFKLDFAGVPPGGSLNSPVMHGTLKTLDVLDGFIGFSFYDVEGDLNATDFPPGSHAETTQANVNMFADQSQGVRACAGSSATTTVPTATPGCRPRNTCSPSTATR